MACRDGGSEAPPDFDGRRLSRLTVDTRKQRRRDRFRVPQLDPPRQKPPNVDRSPREYSFHHSLLRPLSSVRQRTDSPWRVLCLTNACLSTITPQLSTFPSPFIVDRTALPLVDS